MRFADLTRPEVSVVAADGAVAVVPLGCTEQQGPHLAVGFDTWFADELCCAASEHALAELGVRSVVLPALPFGPTPEHRGFGSGFVDLPPSVHDAVLEAVISSLVAQGFTRVLVWRGCGGHDLVNAVERCNRRWAGHARIALPGHPFAEIWDRIGDPNVPGGHADSFATSIALYRHPELVRMDRVPEPSQQPDWSASNLDFTKYSTSGVVGDARAANAELGAGLWEACVEAVAALIAQTAARPDDIGVARLPTAGGRTALTRPSSQDPQPSPSGLTTEQLAEFDDIGVLHLQAAFPAEAADAMRSVAWQELGALYGIREDDPTTWTIDRPARLRKTKRHRAFAAISSEPTIGAFDALLGPGQWVRPPTWGQVMITFPNRSQPWVLPHSLWHVDFRYDNATPGPLFGLKVFAFFGDVGPRGGGTLVIARSHHIVARFLDGQSKELRADFRRARLAFMRSHLWLQQLADPDDSPERTARLMDHDADIGGIHARVVELTGRAGDVVITHPWMVHHVAPNTTDAPRFMRGQSIYRRSPQTAPRWQGQPRSEAKPR